MLKSSIIIVSLLASSVSFNGGGVASVAWRSSQSGRARKGAREQSDGALLAGGALLAVRWLWGGGYLLVMGYWGCATGFGLIVAIDLTY